MCLISLHARSQPYIRRLLGNWDLENVFLKCYCHTGAIGLGNFPVHLGSQTAKSFLKGGHLQFWFLKSHSGLFFALHCQSLPFCVSFHLWLCLCGMKPQLVCHSSSVHSKKIYTSLYTTNKGHKLLFLQQGKFSIIETIHLKGLLKPMCFKTPDKNINTTQHYWVISKGTKSTC